MERLLLVIGEDVEEPAAGLLLREPAIGIADPGIAPPAGREETLDLLVVEAGQGKLVEAGSRTLVFAPPPGPIERPAAASQ